jgi:hypothetical protein
LACLFFIILTFGLSLFYSGLSIIIIYLIVFSFIFSVLLRYLILITECEWPGFFLITLTLTLSKYRFLYYIIFYIIFALIISFETNGVLECSGSDNTNGSDNNISNAGNSRQGDITRYNRGGPNPHRNYNTEGDPILELIRLRHQMSRGFEVPVHIYFNDAFINAFSNAGVYMGLGYGLSRILPCIPRRQRTLVTLVSLGFTTGGMVTNSTRSSWVNERTDQFPQRDSITNNSSIVSGSGRNINSPTSVAMIHRNSMQQQSNNNNSNNLPNNDFSNDYDWFFNSPLEGKNSFTDTLNSINEWYYQIQFFMVHYPLETLFLCQLLFAVINQFCIFYLAFNLLGAKYGYLIKDSKYWIIRFWYNKFAVLNTIYIVIWIVLLALSNGYLLLITGDFVYYTFFV